jgi:signal transduction histidine kinase
VAGWVVWAALPPSGDAVSRSVLVVALWLSTGIVAPGLLLERTPLEAGSLASLRLPLLTAMTAPLSLLPVMASGSIGLVAIAFVVWPGASLLLADVLAGTAPTARGGSLLRGTSALLALASIVVGLAAAIRGPTGALPVGIALILLVGSIATVPGVVGGFAARRADADRLGATSADIVTGIGLAAFGVTPMIASFVLRAPADGFGLVVLVAWLAALAVAARFAVSPLARLADRSSAQRDLVVAVAESERARLAAQLHDGPLQNLLLLTRRLELDGNTAAAAAVRSVAEELRDVCGELRVPILDDLGAGPALEWLVGRIGRLTGDEVLLERVDPARPPASVELAVFRIAQEALSNAARHGRPPIHVRYEASTRRAVLAVDDAGPGIDPDAAGRALRERRFGLQAMAQRAEQIGAHLSVSPCERGGTEVRLVWTAGDSS